MRARLRTSPHVLPRTHVSPLVIAGFPIQTIKELMSHSSITTTAMHPHASHPISCRTRSPICPFVSCLLRRCRCKRSHNAMPWPFLATGGCFVQDRRAGRFAPVSAVFAGKGYLSQKWFLPFSAVLMSLFFFYFCNGCRRSSSKKVQLFRLARQPGILSDLLDCLFSVTARTAPPVRLYRLLEVREYLPAADTRPDVGA